MTTNRTLALAAMTENEHSAARARRVVQQYHMGAAGSLRENMGDLLADLQHLCDADGLPWADMLADAVAYYRADVAWAARRSLGTP